MAKGVVTLEVGSDGVGIITLRNPPVNALAFPVLEGLKEKFDEAVERNDVKAIVVTGANGKFSAGFDISAFKGVQAAGEAASSLSEKVAIGLMQHTIEEARKPSVAAIDGLALGGGLELAMACAARISTPKVQLGLPELQLGIIPGFGGTQRLPRLVGLPKAIEMMLLSKPISAEEGHSLGLVDALSSKEDLLTVARKWALDIAEGRKPWLLSLRRTDKLESLSDAREILKFARAQVKKTAPNMEHPNICLDAVEAGVVHGGYAGTLKEGQGFTEAVASDTSKALIHVFFAMRSTDKIPGITDLGLKPRALKRVAVIGGGLMGSGIATALVRGGIPVLLKEVNDKFLQSGLGRIRANLESPVKKGKMTEEKMEKIFSLVKGTLDYSDFKSVDVVIEAVIENVDLKQNIFADLVKYTSPDCVLSSNTSTIDLNLLAAKIPNAQSRVAGAHFFSPAHSMPLLEIVRTEKTSPAVLLDLLSLGKRIRKTSVVVTSPHFAKTREDPSDDHYGWLFASHEGEEDGAQPDTLNGAKFVRDLYDMADPDAGGRYSVPILWDKKTKTIINNESSEIIKMFNDEFNEFANHPEVNLFPAHLKSKIDEVDSWTYNSINNGVYRSGFATTQAAYNQAANEVFDALDKCGDILSKQRYIAGNEFTEADVRLFVTFVRFDAVYYVHFKCSRRAIREYPNLFNYTKDIYQIPGIAETVNMNHIRNHYFGHRNINPYGIVALEPRVDYSAPHDRDRFSK